MKFLIMVAAMVSQIIFPANDGRNQIELNRITSAKVHTSWNLQTDSAEIVLPRNIIDFDKHKIKSVFKVGDSVEINLGINGSLNQEFKGYITAVSADIPIKLKCEDEMWKLKQLPVNVSLKKTTLPNLMQEMLPSYEVDALEVELGSVRFSKTTVSEVLQKLKDDFGLYSYFKQGVLVVGKIYSDDTNVVDVHLEKMVLKNDLAYKGKEDVKMQIKAISVSSSGEKIEVSVGETGGTEIQLNYYNISTAEELKKLAEVDLQKYNKEGFEGSISVLGDLEVMHGDKVNLTSDLYPDRNGKYYADEVKVAFADSPKFRKKIKIGRKVL